MAAARTWVQGFLAIGFGAATGFAAAAPEPYKQTVPVNVDETVEPLKVDEVEISLSGYVKFVALYSSYSDGDVAGSDAGHDFYRVNSVPVAGSAAAEDRHSFLDLHAKDSRFAIKADSHVAGHTLKGLIEIDFHTFPSASEVVTNPHSPRVRRASITYDNWTIGQDWSLFNHLFTAPDFVDIITWPAGVICLVRQPLVAYKWGDFQFSLENAETNLKPRTGTVSGATPVTADFVTGDAQIPDFLARYDWKPSFGQFGVTVLARELRADNAATGGDAPNDVAHGTAYGYGLTIGGKIPVFAADDVRFLVTAGDGIGRYVALATAADAAIESDGSLQSIALTTAYVAYRHAWSQRWASNVGLASLMIDNPTDHTGTSVTSGADSAHLNVTFTPVDKLSFGLELLHAVRELENGEDGTLDRIEFGTKYVF